VIQGRCWSEIGKVGSSSAKLVPEGRRRIACEAHGTRFSKDSAVVVFRMAVLSQGVGHGDDVFDPQGLAPVLHGFGDEFSIIGDEALERKISLGCHMLVPKLKHRSCIPLASQGKTPDIT